MIPPLPSRIPVAQYFPSAHSLGVPLHPTFILPPPSAHASPAASVNASVDASATASTSSPSSCLKKVRFMILYVKYFSRHLPATASFLLPIPIAIDNGLLILPFIWSEKTLLLISAVLWTPVAHSTLVS